MSEDHFESNQMFRGRLSPFGTVVLFVVDENEPLITLKDKKGNKILSQTHVSQLEFDFRANRTRLVVRFPREDKLFGDGIRHKVVFGSPEAEVLHGILEGKEKK